MIILCNCDDLFFLSKNPSGLPVVTSHKIHVQTSSDNIITKEQLERFSIRVLILKDGLSKPLIASTIVLPKVEIFDDTFN